MPKSNKDNRNLINNMFILNPYDPCYIIEVTPQTTFLLNL